MRSPLALLAVLVALLAGALVVVLRPDGPSSTRVQAAAPLSLDPAAPSAERAARRDAPLVLPRPLPRRTLRVPILMYHRVAAGQGGAYASLTVPPGAFARQMRWLADRGYVSITQRQLFAALIEGAPLPRRPVLITFDDGYREVLETAQPIMARHGLVGTAYVVTDRVAADPNAAPLWLAERHLRALHDAGWDIGSHTVSHRELPSLDDATALRQLRQSRFRLQRILGEPVQWFCYPVGRHDARTVELVRRAGYVLAVTTEPGTLLRSTQPLELPRVRVTAGTDLAATLGA